MKVKVAKWGNGLGVRLPEDAVEMIGATAGSELDLTVLDGALRLSGSRYKTSAERLRELLDQIDPNDIPPMVEWGPDVGSEIIDDDYSRGLIVPGPDGAPVRVDGGAASETQAGQTDARSRRR